MRPWIISGLATILLGCSGGSGEKTSILVELCVEACAHLHEKNCLEAPAADVENCPSQCQGASSEANTGCTDERAALLACQAEATITCTNDPGSQPVISGCDKESQAVESCQSSGASCARSPVNDEICINNFFELKAFFICSEGTGLNPPCQQIGVDAWCCP